MELRERMTKTTVGQVTWADPKIGKTCAQCRFFDRKSKICDKVKLVTGSKGKPFNGDRAIACSVFEALDTGNVSL